MRSPLGRGLLTAVVVAVGLVVFRSCVGCGPNDPTKQGTQSDGRANQGTQLAARLAGEWVSKDDDTVTVFFTDGTHKLVYSYSEKVRLPMQSRLGPPVYTGEVRKNVQTYEIESFSDSSITMKKHGLGVIVVEFEFPSDNEFFAIYKCK